MGEDGLGPRELRRFPPQASGYELREQIGQGMAASVFRAWCPEMDEEVAIKIMNLEWLQAPLDDIRREIQVMSLSNHENVAPYSTSFVQGNDLWVVMPLLTGGSVLSLMTCTAPNGLREDLAKYILHSIVKALDYFHSNRQMHRDVRAANVMFNAHGKVMLSDYGMMGWMVEGGWERKQRQTFVGTPCWMAPEVMEQSGGYDYKADIWSLGITAIEIAQGRAPYSNFPPMKVLVLTIQNPPPRLSKSAEARFSEDYRDFISQCLQKDPKARPTARELVKHKLFENAAIPPYLEGMLADLPPLGSRGSSQKNLYRQLRKVADPPRSGIWELKSKGLGWNFDDHDNGGKKLPLPGKKGLKPREDMPVSDSNLTSKKHNDMDTSSSADQSSDTMERSPTDELPIVGVIPGGALPPPLSFSEKDESIQPVKTFSKFHKGRFIVSDVDLGKDMSIKLDEFIDGGDDSPSGSSDTKSQESSSFPTLPETLAGNSPKSTGKRTNANSPRSSGRVIHSPKSAGRMLPNKEPNHVVEKRPSKKSRFEIKDVEDDDKIRGPTVTAAALKARTPAGVAEKILDGTTTSTKSSVPGSSRHSSPEIIASTAPANALRRTSSKGSSSGGVVVPGTDGLAGTMVNEAANHKLPGTTSKGGGAPRSMRGRFEVRSVPRKVGALDRSGSSHSVSAAAVVPPVAPPQPPPQAVPVPVSVSVPPPLSASASTENNRLDGTMAAAHVTPESVSARVSPPGSSSGSLVSMGVQAMGIMGDLNRFIMSLVRRIEELEGENENLKRELVSVREK